MASLRNQALVFPPLLVAAALVILNMSVYKVAGRVMPSVILLSSAVFFVTIVLSYWHAGRLTKPLLDLVPQADGIAKGRLEVSNHGITEVPQEVRGLAKAIEEIGEKQARDFAAMQKLERVRSEFLGNVSHELRTPIFAVQGFIETLLDGAIDDPNVNRDFLERASLQAARLNNLLSDLIDISRIESGEMKMSYRFFDVVPFLREVVREMHSIAEHKHMSVQFIDSLPENSEVEVFGDKERLKQVMTNLIDNALKYGASSEPVIVELRDKEPDADSVTISVTDRGRGIGAEHLPRLFERFYRVDKDRSRSSVGGTGLGLAICKHIVEGHRSRIVVTSTVGEGSTFTFALPKIPFMVAS